MTTNSTATALASLSPEMLRDMASEVGACVRPLIKLLTDTMTGEQSNVAIPCGATRESKCPSCAAKARRLRMQQCREGWHREDEPEHPDPDTEDQEDGLDVAEDAETDPEDEPEEPARRVRSTRRRQDVPDLPRVPMDKRTVGRAFTTSTGRTYRPSMFVTLTLPSYGRVRDDGTPVDPTRYDYRSAALDAMHFPKVIDRFIQNLRRCAGFNAQYFGAVEPQKRLAPHLHLGIRGALPRALLKEVAAGTYFQLWWPAHETPVYAGGIVPVWDELQTAYVDPATREPLPTWEQALDSVDADPAAKPAHVVRLGKQTDIQGIIAESGQADRRVGYLCKYLTKSVSETYGEATTRQTRHMDRLYEEVRWLPCAPACSNWLRYGVQPDGATAGMEPGKCAKRAHDRENLGLGGRRVLVSRQWTGKTLTEHKADRSEVVRQVLEAAGVDLEDTDRCSATALTPDGRTRFIWESIDPTENDRPAYRHALLASIRERGRWRAQYEDAKTRAGPDPGTCSATEPEPAGTAA